MKTFLQYLAESNKVQKNNAKLPIAEKAIAILEKAVDTIKDDYTKCMAVVDLFDKNGGTLSEKILTYWLKKCDGIKPTTKQIGDSQGLTDIEVDTNEGIIRISLKTTDETASIGLGQLEDKLKNVEVKNNVKDLTKIKTDLKTDDLYLKDIKVSSVKSHIQNRISAIVDKLCGTEKEPEVFFWITKKYAKKTIDGKLVKILKNFIFNIYVFDRATVTKFLEDKCKIHITKDAWGLNYKLKDGKEIRIVQSDSSNKALNINPKFITTQEVLSQIKMKRNKTIELTTYDEKRPKGVMKASEIITKLNDYSLDKKDNVDSTYVELLMNMYDKLANSK